MDYIESGLLFIVGGLFYLIFRKLVAQFWRKWDERLYGWLSAIFSERAFELMTIVMGISFVVLEL